jgi:GntR family transcriptional regulator
LLLEVAADLLYTNTSTVNPKFIRLNPSSAAPLYLQLVEQIKHAIETCALMPGTQLPGIRTLAQQLVVSPTTVVKAYSELEHEGVIELRQGAGAFVIDQERTPKQASRVQAGKEQVHDLVGRLRSRGFTEAEIRRLFEAELTSVFEDAVERGSR